MPQAEYLGTAAKYSIGPHVFEKARPESLTQTVDENIAKFLRENPLFSVDGKGGVKTTVDEDDPVDAAIIPADGFKSRDEALAFAAKWMPKLELERNRSTAELQRRIEAELKGVQVDAQGEVAPLQAETGPAKVAKVEPKTKVAV